MEGSVLRSTLGSNKRFLLRPSESCGSVVVSNQQHPGRLPQRYRSSSAPVIRGQSEQRRTASLLSERRSWATFTTEGSTAGSNGFRILNWNLLAPRNVDYKRYHQVERKVLHWRNRRAVIVTEILQQSPDVIGLQEVDYEGYYNYLKPELEARGFEGFYVHKRAGFGQDGVAVFWRTERFSLIEAQAIPFQVGKLLDRPHVGALVALNDLQQQERLIIANTHLLFNSKRGDIKLGQLLLLMTSLFTALRKHSTVVSIPLERLPPNLFNFRVDPTSTTIELLSSTPATLLVGDLNFIPASRIYAFVRDGFHDFADTLDGRLSVRNLSGQYLMENGTYPIIPEGHGGRGGSKSFEESTIGKPEAGTGGGINGPVSWLAEMLKELDAVTVHRFSQRHCVWVDALRQSTKAQSGRTEEDLDGMRSLPFNKHCNSVVESAARHSAVESAATHSAVESAATHSAVESAATHSAVESAATHSAVKSAATHSAVESAATHSAVAGSSCNNSRRPFLLQHPFPFKSAYVIGSPSSSKLQYEPAYTTYHGWQKGCVDYVWYSTNELQVDQILQMPSQRDLRLIGSIPHLEYQASDHFDLVVDLKYTPTGSRRVAVVVTPMGECTKTTDTGPGTSERKKRQREQVQSKKFGCKKATA